MNFQKGCILMEEVIKCQNLTKKFGQELIFEDLSFAINKGEIFVILGKNGAGKSTLIKILLGMIYATKGEVKYARIKKNNSAQLYSKMGAVLESVDNIYPFLSGIENIRYFLSLSGKSYKKEKQKVHQWVQRFQLQQAIHKPAGAYSRGMQQKLAIICALVKETDILFLDEPTLGLDFQSNKEIMAIIEELARQEQKTIVLTSHQADVLETLSDRVLLLNNGKQLYYGSYSTFIKQFESDMYEIVFNFLGEPSKEIILEGEETAQLELQNLIKQGYQINRFEKRKKNIEEILREVYHENSTSIRW